ncbi:MAG: hypothetical protein O7D86_01695 [Proteobacteria bacterium]|nr:hypothetical protein [Pseudomonadota bacterium]
MMGLMRGSSTDGEALVYPIHFETPGTYYVYIYGQAPDETSIGQPYSENNSLHVGLDGIAVTTGNSDGLNNGFISSAPRWGGSNLNGPVTTISVPSAGVHEFWLWMREDGLVIDKIFLSSENYNFLDESNMSIVHFGPVESIKEDSLGVCELPPDDGIESHRFKFFFNPDLVPDMAFAKTVLPKYVEDMRWDG